MATIRADTSPVAAALFAVAGGKFRMRKDKDGFVPAWSAGRRVLDDDGNVIGSAHRIYDDGYAVETPPYWGYVPDSQIEWEGGELDAHQR